MRLPPPAHLAVVILLAAAARAGEVEIADVASFAAAARRVGPGDVMILRSGTWTDAHLALDASGTADRPVILRAERPGGTVFTGDSRLSLAGSHIVVEGLWFKNPTGPESIELRIDSDDSRRRVADDCRITQCAVTGAPSAVGGRTGSAGTRSCRFLSVYGSRHRIDHCHLEGKTTEGATLAIWLEADVVAAHRIDHNSFGHRPPLGRNGGETIRIGDSKTAALHAGCVVEHNLFERCNGEAECISNKSGGNVYRDNVFRATSGALTLRHGDGCRVERNTFLGERAAGTGGVRIVGVGHSVVDNHFEGLRGDDERSAVCLMLGIADSPANGYAQVARVRIERNTFVDCEHNILVGLRGSKRASLPPIDCVIADNRIDTGRGAALEPRCTTAGNTITDNVAGPDIVPQSASRAAGRPPEAVGPAWRP